MIRLQPDQILCCGETAVAELLINAENARLAREGVKPKTPEQGELL